MALAAVVFVVWLRPPVLGGTTSYIIVSGNSMEPGMGTGDLAVVRRSSSYRVGDVMAYRIPKDDVGAGIIVIHRIIGGSASEGYLLQGDNRDRPDFWRPKGEDIVGKMWFSVPKVGRGMVLLRSPIAIAFFAALSSFAFVMTDPRSKKRHNEEAEPEVEETSALSLGASGVAHGEPLPAEAENDAHGAVVAAGVGHAPSLRSRRIRKLAWALALAAAAGTAVAIFRRLNRSR